MQVGRCPVYSHSTETGTADAWWGHLPTDTAASTSAHSRCKNLGSGRQEPYAYVKE